MATKLSQAVAAFADSKPGLFIADSPSRCIELVHSAFMGSKPGIECTAPELGAQLALGGRVPIQRGNLTLGIKYHLTLPGHAVSRST